MVHAEAFGSLLNLPVSHAVHTRSDVADGAFATKVPASQVTQGEQTMALAVVLKVAGAQVPHMRSVVEVGSATT